MKSLMIMITGLILLGMIAVSGCTDQTPAPPATPIPTPVETEPTAPPTEPAPTPVEPTPTETEPTEPTPTPAEPTPTAPIPTPTVTETPSETDPSVPLKAAGTIKVGALNFNDLSIGSIHGLTAARYYSVTDIATIREVGGDEPVTFMKAGTTTLQVYADEAGTILLATGTVTIPEAFGEHPFEISLTRA